MSQPDNPAAAAPGPPAVTTATAAAAGPPRLDPAAIGAAVRRTREQGKRRVSRPLRELVRADRHIARAAHRLARATAKGLGTYRERQDASAEARRDGAVTDQPLNAAHGLAVAMVAASEAPVDVARAMSTRTGRRLVRRVARLVGLSLG